MEKTSANVFQVYTMGLYTENFLAVLGFWFKDCSLPSICARSSIGHDPSTATETHYGKHGEREERSGSECRAHAGTPRNFPPAEQVL